MQFITFPNKYASLIINDHANTKVNYTDNESEQLSLGLGLGLPPLKDSSPGDRPISKKKRSSASIHQYVV